MAPGVRVRENNHMGVPNKDMHLSGAVWSSGFLPEGLPSWLLSLGNSYLNMSSQFPLLGISVPSSQESMECVFPVW